MARTVLSLLGTQLDRGSGPKRWKRWRPTVSVFQHDDVWVDRLILAHPTSARKLACTVRDDVLQLSTHTAVELRPLDLHDPWDFEEVYGALHELASTLAVDEEDELWVHISTGTHVAQICLFLLTESRHLPGVLLQTGPPRREVTDPGGSWSLIDLDLARYDRLAARFAEEQERALDVLKSGIQTRNEAFNALMERIEQVALASDAPIVLTGPTGSGKSHLARRIYALRQQRRQLTGPLVEVNCATLRGDAAMSALFGHVRGAFTGADRAREGLLRAADGGLLFLDEVAELGPDEQALLLRAIEERRWLPVGSDREVGSDFQLIVGSHRDLRVEVREGRFRDDLLARIDLWHFRLPGLAERREDLAPNLDYELRRWTERTGRRVAFNREARAAFESFAMSAEAVWVANFRDLNAAVTRMATLAGGRRIDRAGVDEEIGRLRASWGAAVTSLPTAEPLDLFDRIQLEGVLAVCASSKSLSDAGRRLFAESRKRRKSVNDADRLRKYLARFGLTWDEARRRG